MSKIFGSEALRRYMLWAGAEVDVAWDMASSPDDRTADWMPENPLTGSSYTVRELSAAFDSIGHALPEGGDAFVTTRPDLMTGNTEDAGLAATASAQQTTPLFVGLTGGRGVGKSYLTTELVKEGFVRVHPFNPGKALLRGYYVSRGATEDEAFSMTDGELKDRPAPAGVLPIDPETGQAYTSRFLMEKLGFHMAKVVGLSSTIGTELRHWASSGETKILVDSVVYEADEIRKMDNSAILKIVVPEGAQKETGIKAEITDANVAKITPDALVVNEMNGVGPLMESFNTALATCGVSHEDPRLNEMEP